jgi:hypothetical protein
LLTVRAVTIGGHFYELFILLLPVAEQPSRIRGPDPSDSQNPARVQRILLDWTSNTAFFAVRCSPLNLFVIN